MEFKGRVVVYSIPACPYCKRAKSLLEEIGVPYHDIDVERHTTRRTEMYERTGRRSVPQIFFNDLHIGGYDDLKKLKDEGGLDDLLKNVADNEAPPTTPCPLTEEEISSPNSSPDLPMEGGNQENGCVPDEYAQLVREIHRSGLIGNHSYRLKIYKDCFVGRDLVQWLMSNKKSSHEEAVKIGRELVARHFIHHVTHDHNFEDDNLFYRFLGEDSRKALNAKLTHQCLPRPANDISTELRKAILKLYGEHLSPDGLAVDYAAIGRSPLFEEYVQATAELKRADVKILTRQEKLVFFINVYNALVIHAFVVRGPPTNLFKRLKFFNLTSYIIGGLAYSLNDIESGVLRGNRKPIAAIRRPFSANDPRRVVAFKEVEPRIHFALVCGARSCPPIKMYSPENVEEELTIATESFLEGDNCIVDLERREISMSMILKWYRADFGASNEEMLHWVAHHMAEGDKKAGLNSLLSSGRYKLKFQTYNWDLNSS